MVLTNISIVNDRRRMTQNLREEIDNSAHGLTHTHAPNQSPDLKIEDCQLETAPGSGILMSFTGASLHLKTPDGVVAFDWFEQPGIVWILGHDSSKDNTTANSNDALAEICQKRKTMGKYIQLTQ